MEKFNPTVNGFLGLLNNQIGKVNRKFMDSFGLSDNQIGRVTRKFMEQGYHIAVSICDTMPSF